MTPGVATPGFFGSRSVHQKIAAVRMMFSMWLTEDVVAKRADHLTDAERTVMAKCALCGKEAKGRRNEHLLFECTAASVVELRKEVEAAVEKKVSRLVKPGPVREAIMVPWRLDKAGRPPNVGVMAEVEAALGTVLGAETPAEGLRRDRAASNRSTGATAGPARYTSRVPKETTYNINKHDRRATPAHLLHPPQKEFDSTLGYPAGEGPIVLIF